jgi:hypothetical protein
MIAHTRGPWYRDNFGHLINSDGYRILFCGVTIVTSGAEVPIGEANATLISAAPDLLAACARLVRQYGSDGTAYSGDHPIAIAREAIAKAAGETE